ncbi:DYH14 protein, partial [Halcyon senegalensis]|nr:DYH14 protein [Halcyon senegalensis]
HEEHLPQRDDENKMLKEKLVSRLRFEPERTEVLLMAKAGYILCEPADDSEKDGSEKDHSELKTYFTLRTAVYRASRERKHKATTKEEGMCFGKVHSRIHKVGRDEFVCQSTNMSENETMKLKRSLTKPASLMSKNEYLKKTTEMQTAVLQPSCHKKTCDQTEVERSSKKPLRSKVHSYDQTEPTDDDGIVHILRLRGKLGWQTKLPPREWLAREADVVRLQKFTPPKSLLLKDSGEYIYCLERNRNNFKAPYNPYDLQAVSTNTAMQNKEYWTVTASFVSK